MLWSHLLATAAVAAGVLVAILLARIAHGIAPALTARAAASAARLVQAAGTETGSLATGAAGVVVTALNQTVVNDLKATGGWNAQTAADTRATAISRLKDLLGAPAVMALQAGRGSVDPYLGQLVEYAVATAPNRQRAPGATPAG